jgi:hypothetical protein
MGTDSAFAPQVPNLGKLKSSLFSQKTPQPKLEQTENRFVFSQVFANRWVVANIFRDKSLAGISTTSWASSVFKRHHSMLIWTDEASHEKNETLNIPGVTIQN